MPNPKANKPLTLEQIKADAMSMGIPARALLDMIYSGGRSAVATTAGLPADIANTAIGLHNMARDVRRRKFEGYEPGTIPGGSEDIKGLIPDIAKDPNSNLNKMADFGGNFAIIPGAGTATAKGAKMLGKEIADRVATGQKLMPGPFAEPQMAMFAVKPKGGSWLNHSPEGFLKGLKSENRLISPSLFEGFEQSAKDPTDPLQERSIRRLREHNNEIAVNNWIDKNLTNYVKNEMGTEHDPIRKLADQGIIHAPIDDSHISGPLIYNKRREANLPEEGFATTELGKKWEKLTDKSINNAPVKEYLNEDRYQVRGGRLPAQTFKNEAEANEFIKQVQEKLGDKPFGGEGLTFNKILEKDPFVKTEIGPVHENPWLLKKNPEDTVHHAFDLETLGFDHLMDVLKEDLANGRIQPEDLKNYSIDRAVRRAHEYNEDMAKKMAETAIKQTESMPVVKEYPSGHKWIELAPEKMPEGYKLPEGYTVTKDDRADFQNTPWFVKGPHGDIISGDKGLFYATPEEALKNATEKTHSENAYQKLADALKYEGDTMGHCVGGYCPDVLEGRSRIFSLRDAKGEPHVTIETKPNPYPVSGEAFAMLPQSTKAQYGQYVREWRQRNPDIQNLTDEHTIQALKEAGVPPQPDDIVQIKGKGNKKPVDKYIPMVQNFQRTTGFPIKGDIQNSGFVDTHPELKKLGESIGLKVPDYLTKDEENVLHQQVAPHIESMVKNANDFLDTHPAFEPHRQATREFNDALSKEFSTNEPVYTQQEMNELERRSLQSIHPEFPYHFNEIKKVLNNPEEHGEGDPLKTQLYNLGKIDELRNKVGDVPTVQPTVTPNNPQGLAKGGRVKRKVHVANDLDMMRHEIQMKDSPKGFAGGGIVDKMIGKGVSKLFSAVDKTAAELPRSKGTGKEFIIELSKKPGVKKAELADRNLHEINDLPKMTKDEFQAELAKRPVPKVYKKILSNDAEPLQIIKHNPDSILDDKHWVVDSNGEPVTAHPFPSREDAESHIENHEIDENQTHHEGFKLPGGNNYQEHLYKYEPEGQPPFVANEHHFGAEPNVLASARTVDRRTPDGKKILHVEEIQSDWHQDGRKYGYKDSNPEAKIEQLKELKQTFDDLNKRRRILHEQALREPEAGLKFESLMEEANGITPKLLELNSQMYDLDHLTRQNINAVPDAPFKNNWEHMVSKDLVKHAIDNGYDAIALTPGKEQADRYSLAKQINKLIYVDTASGTGKFGEHLHGEPTAGKLQAFDHRGNKVIDEDINPHELPDYIGKEAASKLLESKPFDVSENSGFDGNRWRELANQDLNIGGEGMKAAYDKRIPNTFNDIGKPYGAEMKLNELPVLNSGKHYANRTIEGDSFNVMDGNDNIISSHPTQQEANIKARELNSTPLHYMEFTPEMKQNVATESLPAYADGGQVKHPGFINPSLKLANGSVTLNPLEFMPNYQRGGKVHVTDDLDMMRHEVHMAGGGSLTNNVLKKVGQFITKAEKVPAVPLSIPRSTPKTLEDIDKIATRVAKQMIGEHVRPENSTKTVNLAGRSMRESERIKGLPYQIQPTGAAQKAEAYTPQIGDVNVSIPGDQTISDSILRHAGDIEDINSIQEGGSKYGLGKMSLEHPLFWASGEDPAQMAQDKITRLAGYYEPNRVIGQHLAMGPVSNNFAMHLADANLRATDLSKMKPEQMYSFDNIIANGYVKKNAKTGEYEHINFPHWPGIADPESAYKAMQEDPELRKWYNSRMKTPDITSAHGLPNGLDIQWAITEPALRNMEVNLTGLSAGKMVPGAELTDTANHNTYNKGIQGLALQPQTPPAPFEITFPDATQHVRSTKNPTDFTGTIQKVFPHQLVDDQYLNEVGQYNDLIKKYTGQKKGGRVKAKKANKKANVQITDNIEIMRHELSTRG